MHFISAAIVMSLVSLVQAHMEMAWPPPIRSVFNKYTTDPDWDLTSPLNSDGSDFPCKGYQNLFDTKQGRSVVTWQPGQSYNWTITGSATHSGGSCQVSLSYDRGSTWTVLHSYIGACPLKSAWNFNLPSDAPAGEALFAFTWYNNVGNRELYMNCAHVTIANRASQQPSPAAAFSSRPRTFFANVGNGCSTVEGYDVVFPNPGPNTDNVSRRPLAPRGNCARKRAVQTFQA